MESPSSTHWALLAIEPTRDASVIRRAYARQIKAGPDAERFQRLRRAREAALREAGTPETAIGIDKSFDAIMRSDRARRSKADERHDDESIAEDEVSDEPPRGRVVQDIFPLAETERSRAEARRLRSTILASLEEGIDGPQFETAIQQAAMLSRAPRRELEAVCINALAGDWRKPDGDLDAARVARIIPPLVAADHAFGWAGDDSVLTETLSPCDVDALIAILDEAECRSRSRRLPPALRMRRPDVLAYFAKSEARRGVYEKAIARGRVPWRIDLFAAAAPHLWAWHHRLWRELVPLFLLFSVPSAALWLLRAKGYFQGWILVVLSALLVAIAAGVGLFADRMLLAAAERAVMRADAKGLYDKAPRAAFLSERKRLPSPVFFLFLIFQILFPYRILQEALARLGG